MFKRGIAPIVATLLLVSFAIALGVVIMNFAGAQVELEAQCPINIGLHLVEIGGSEQLCFNEETKQIEFVVENGVNIKVDALFVSVIGSQKAENYELEADLPKAGSFVGNAAVVADTHDQIRQVKISPIITLYDEEHICDEKAIIKETIPSC